MALPEIPGLYDVTGRYEEIYYGNSLGAIYEANGRTYDWWLEKIATFVYNQSSCPNYSLTCGSEHSPEVPSAGLDFLTSDGFTGNKCVVLCYGDAWYQNWNDFNCEPCKTKQNDGSSGESTYSANLWGRNVLNSQHPVLESDTREHYIALPTIRARNEAGQEINVPYGTYKSTYLVSHPYIRAISMQYYYKKILENNTVSERAFSFALPMLKTGSNWMYYVPYTVGYPHYRYMMRDTTIVRNFRGAIFQAPALSVRSMGDYYSCALSNQEGTHGNGYHFYPGDVSQNYQPQLYITFEEATAMINSVGFWWAESLDDIKYNALGENTTADTVHCPKVTSGGATTTSDYKGSEIKVHWKEPGYRQNGGISLVYTYNVNPNEEEDRSGDASEDPDPLPNESQVLEMEQPKFTGVGCFSTYYAMNMAQIRHFNDDMWTSDEDWLTSVILGLRFWGQNPMEAIMSLRLYPFDVLDYITSDGQEHIKLGRNAMPTATGEILAANSTALLHLGSVYMRPNFNDFRDFAPYTQIQLYVPYVGFIELNPNEFMNHIMGVDMVVDVTTGTCEVCVYADSRPMIYKSGTMAVEIPVSLNSMTQLSAALMQGIFNVSTSIGTAAVNYGISSGGTDKSTATRKEAATDTVPLIELTSSDIGNIAMDIAMGASTTQQSGQSSPACNMANTPYPYLIISTPIDEIPDNYNHTYGKVCHVSGKVSSFVGFTVCRNVDTSGITCTSTEQNLIKQLLEHGIYV